MPTLLSATNILSLLVNNQTDFIANIIDTDQDLFLVSTKSSSNVEYLRLVAEEPTLREVLEKIEHIGFRTRKFNGYIIPRLTPF